MVDPGAINYLNNKCIDSSSSESYKNTDRKNQYTNIETTVYATLDTVGDIYP
ncbi:hypothetical protein KKH82_07280 [Patescibacteria group bacterium]|nr:hypothetical protein [Patescibacteria group bacterium]